MPPQRGLSLQEAQQKILTMYVQLKIRNIADSEIFDPSMNECQLFYMAEQLTTEGIETGFVSQEEASGACDLFVTALQALVNKTLQVSPAAFQDHTSPRKTLPGNSLDIDIPMNEDTAAAVATGPHVDSPRKDMGPSANSFPFVHLASSGSNSTLPTMPQHPGFNSSTSQFARSTNLDRNEDEDDVEVEMQLRESGTLSGAPERGKTRSPDRNLFNVGSK